MEGQVRVGERRGHQETSGNGSSDQKANEDCSSDYDLPS